MASPLYYDQPEFLSYKDMAFQDGFQAGADHKEAAIKDAVDKAVYAYATQLEAAAIAAWAALDGQPEIARRAFAKAFYPLLSEIDSKALADIIAAGAPDDDDPPPSGAGEVVPPMPPITPADGVLFDRRPAPRCCGNDLPQDISAAAFDRFAADHTVLYECDQCGYQCERFSDGHERWTPPPMPETACRCGEESFCGMCDDGTPNTFSARCPIHGTAAIELMF